MPTVADTRSMLPVDTFRDKTIVITGGGTGLGRSMGVHLLSLGANLVIGGSRANPGAAEGRHGVD